MRPANAKPLPSGREHEVDELLRAVREWAGDRADLRAVALVGSWARGEAHAGSDVDIVLLTEAPGMYVDDAEWARPLGAVEVLRTQRWGVLTERRMALGSGTARVVADASSLSMTPPASFRSWSRRSPAPRTARTS